MFSPGVPSHSHSLRPKRTRLAAGPDDSLKLPQAKRKRSALRHDTFEPEQGASLNEIAARGVSTGNANGHPVNSEKAPSFASGPSKELTLRGGKKGVKRSERGSGALTLSDNEFYNVAQLPALPDQIRSRPTVPYSCAISPDYGYALAFTHSDALIWSYNSSATSPSSRELLSFKIPFPPSSASDPLPLATFTARSAGGEPGIVAVSPRWGKIVYWETITNASSFVPGQTSSGVQGSIPGMFSGETVKEITNAEPSGFILSFSHGRVAHLTIRDQMGRPGIGIQFLRKGNSGAVGGIFGSIRNAFGGDRRKGTPSIRAGRSSKGQRDVVVAAEDGEIEFWNTNLGLGNSLIKSLSIKEDMLEALKHNLPDSVSADLHFKLLDFELAAGPSTGQDLTRLGAENSTPVTLLAGLSYADQTTYYIIESIITETTCSIKVVHPIKCYTAPISESPTWHPKLYLPKLSETAFIIFEKAIVLFSLAKIEESPSSQLLLERQALPDPFQDCIRFQDDTIYRVLGLSMEEQEKHEKQSSCVFAVQGFGLVRISATTQKPSHDDDDDDAVAARISPKSKIEQAVFFGTNRQNPLDLLSSTAGQTFTAEEISSAALGISSEILSSKSRYLPKTTPAIDVQMKLRAKALEDLAHYILKHYASSLSRATRFQLLWDAEKLATAQAIWKVQEDIQRRYPDLKDRECTYMQFVLRALHGSRQTYPEESRGEIDSVRHWLTHDPARVGYFITELVSCLQELPEMYILDPRVVVDYLREADDLWIAAYEAAFKFREDNAQSYGLGDEIFKDGILAAGYPEELQPVWTSDSEPFVFAQQFVYAICKFLEEWWDYSPVKNKKKKMPTDDDGKPYEAPSKKAMVDLAKRLPVQVELFYRLIEEESIRALEKAKLKETDPAVQVQVVTQIKHDSRIRSRDAITAISRFNMPGAIKLAEKLADTGLLVALNTSYLRKLASEQVLTSAADPTEAAKLEEQIATVQDHCETYFDKFGNSWAFAHFSHRIRENEVNAMLMEAQADNGKKQKYLNWFLKKCKANNFRVRKISWINEIVGERRYDKAQSTLEAVAKDEEEDLWGKRTEICLAKLAQFAAVEDSEARGRTADSIKRTDSREYDNALAALNVQETVYEHLAPTMVQTIDMMAAQEVVSDVFAKRVTEKQPTLRRILKRGLDAVAEKRALTPTQLVDVLTLMDPFEFSGADDERDPGLLGREFSLALKVIDVSEQLNRGEKEAWKRVVWRRAMIRDDWVLLNETSLKDDAQVEREMRMTSLFLALVQVLGEEGPAPKLYSPQEILDADLFPVALQIVLEDVQLEGVEKDLELEQERLRAFVEKGRLEMHFGGLVTTAQDTVRGERDREGEEAARAVLGEENQDQDVGLNMDLGMEKGKNGGY